jgi:hypothetical protein
MVRALWRALVSPGGEASQSSGHLLVQFFSEIDCPKKIGQSALDPPSGFFRPLQFHDKIEREGARAVSQTPWGVPERWQSSWELGQSALETDVPC